MHRTAVVAALLLVTACGSRQVVPSPAPGRDGLVPAAAGTPRPGETVRAIDLDHDGQPDVWSYSVKGTAGHEVLVRTEKDLDNDGRIDGWEAYDADGALTRLSYDMDLDGMPDVTLSFEEGQLVRKAYAFGSDGVPPTSSTYRGNALVRKERDTDGDGRVDTWEYWENGEVDRIGSDLDGDGQADRWETRAHAPASEGVPGPRR